jgi:hypothetical protein
MRKRAAQLWRRSRGERRLPIFLDRPAGILPRFGTFTKVVQHRIDGALQRDVPSPDRTLHALPFSIAAELLELLVWVKDQSRPGKPARETRAAAMQTDDVKGLAAKAKGKARVPRIGGNERIPRLLIERVQVLQLQPKKPLEGVLIEGQWRPENRDEARVFLRPHEIGAGESGKIRVKLCGRFRRSQFLVGAKLVGAGIHRCFCAEARKSRVGYESGESRVNRSCKLQGIRRVFCLHNYLTPQRKLSAVANFSGARRGADQ